MKNESVEKSPANKPLNKLFFTVIILSFLASFATCYFAVPTVSGGRDQGAIATAAIDLANNKSFVASAPASQDLFQKYGPGKALNYPGFDYTKNGELMSRFPKAYIAYLAGFYGISGLAGIQYANFFPLFLFFILFWLTLKYYFRGRDAFAGFLVAVTFFPFLWFAKYTLTEIFMLFWIWAGLYFLIRFCRCSTPTSSASNKYLFISLAAFALSALTRIEGLAFLFLAIAYIFYLNKRKFFIIPKKTWNYITVGIIIFLGVYFLANSNDLLDSAKNFIKIFLPGSGKDSAPSANLYARLLFLFLNYNLLVYIVAGIAGIIYLLWAFKKNFLKPEFIPLLILFPSLIYIMFPTISLDDPWIFRRYAFAVFPLLIFYSVFFIDRVVSHKLLRNIIFAFLILSNLTISAYFFKKSENTSLLPQVAKISQNFGPSDLILVDRLASGSGWSLISDPLTSIYGKNAVYFFNPDDLKLINRSHYKNIYLIAPLADVDTWYQNLPKDLSATVKINNNYLETSKGLFFLSENVNVEVQDGIWKLK